jgi:hypothetical protein
MDQARTIPEAIRPAFQAAKAAIMRRDPDTPPPIKVSDGDKGQPPAPPHAPVSDRPAARGCYAVLSVKTKAGKAAKKFSRAAEDVTAEPEIYEEPGFDMWDPCNPLGYQQLWQDEAIFDCFDDFEPPPDLNFPQPG